MKKYNFTAEELNTILEWGGKGEAKHSTRWNRLRSKFADMDEDQFNEVYRAFYDSDGIIFSPTKKPVSENEADITNSILTMISSSNFPISFSDIYFAGKFDNKLHHCDLRDRMQKIIDTLEEKGAIEGLRVIKIMTQGKCHIKLYEIR